jgi:hypothetical protein
MNKTLKAFKDKYGEGTAADLDNGKLVILGLTIYIAILFFFSIISFAVQVF